ncbi:MAG: hypothetical protein IJV95_01775 [Clostridia bacterium]|nr:hypothetical protein [Clostridia bacterium]
MRKTLLKLFTAMLVICFALGSFTACSDDPSSEVPDGDGGVKTLSSSLLDGKIANFMGAEGFGIIDKTNEVQPVNSGASTFSVSTYADESNDEQKKTEFAKETENGYVDVHFHNTDDTRKSYKDLNKKYSKHHHNSVECPKTDCDEISDEITLEESSGEVDTVISLDARVNKLYNYGNFTFMSVSSAIEGKVRVLYEVFQPTVAGNTIVQLKGKASYPTLINIENQYHIDGGKWLFGYIKIEANGSKPAGVIPIKVSSNETGYHTANYWSDTYNQSYIIDNNTGITYSLSRFPYIYSVENGVIKVHDENAPGWFRYYEPTVVDGEMTFKEKVLPTDEEFLGNLPKCGSSTSAMIDIYGNMLFNTRSSSGPLTVDEYGEKKYGNNIILATASKQVYDGIPYQYPSNVANQIQSRYSNANRYHLGSDGKIYRVDFRGLMSNVKVDVLGQNATWQTVPNDTTVTFEGNSGYIGWQMGGMSIGLMDMYRITKISNGYAYYSTACSTDGGMVWGSPYLRNEMIQLGDFVGVTKIPVTGPDENNSHLDFMETFEYNGVSIIETYTIFLVGKTQMMYMDSKGVKVLDVETGETIEIDGVEKVNDGYLQQNPLWDNIVLKINGQTKYLNLLKEIDFDNVTSSFGDEYVKIGGELEAYFKFVKNV